MIEFRTNLKAKISTEYSYPKKDSNKGFSTGYSASVKQNIIDRKMRVSGSKFPSRFISESSEKR